MADSSKPAGPSKRGDPPAPVTLLIVSKPDIGSTVQGDALLERPGWSASAPIGEAPTWRHDLAPVDLWWYPERLLFADHLDAAYSEATGRTVREVLFLSRHAAASGQPSLTLHAIGVPAGTPVGEVGEYGGRNGEVVPPCSRFSALFLALLQAAERHGLTPEFDITVETTHHGPVLSAPTLFIEIGSTESHWGRRDAAAAWAEVLSEALGLEGGVGAGDWLAMSEGERAESQVMVGLGGGHYAPRHSDVVRRTGCWMGHLLAGYALPMEKPDEEGWEPLTGRLPGGEWRHAIDIAIASTEKAFPGGRIVVHLDRKSFKGWQRQAIRRHLEEAGVSIVRTADLIS